MNSEQRIVNSFCDLEFVVWNLISIEVLKHIEIITDGGLAQLARASALHAEGHRFDSDILHFFKYANL